MFKSLRFPLLCAVLTMLVMVGCQTPKTIGYFQDIQQGQNVPTVQPKYITFQPGDKTTIIVKSKDPELAELFNLSTVSYRVGQGVNSNYYGGSQNVSFYTIDADGNIDFPVIGKIHIAGLQRGEVASLIKGMLVGKDLVKDAVVTCDFVNLNFSVLGEVTRPGQYSIDRDQITLLDAIGKAGDLTIYGKRDSVTVLRNEDGQSKVYKVNLCSWKDVSNSPAYFIKQNDVVYVTPNNTRARQSTVNGNNVRSTSFWISLASLFTSIAVLLR